MGRTLRGDSSGETDRLKAEISLSYGLTSVESWRWIKRGESPAVATIDADGRRFVTRLFANQTDASKVGYISQFGLHLASVGVEVEEVVRTAAGEPYAHLPSGVLVVLSQFHPDPPMPVPFGARQAQAWGRYVSRLHLACREWRPPTPLPSPWLRREPSVVLERALALTAHFPEPRGILEEAAQRIVGCWEAAPPAQPVHGDLWPGNLLFGPHGLRAIDFAEAGQGPRTIDLATACRWMPWRDDPAGAARLWEAWLAGYTEMSTVAQAELDAASPMACLQHLIWMENEVGTSTSRVDSSRYIEDHCSAIQALLEAS